MQDLGINEIYNMIRNQIRVVGVTNEKIMNAMMEIPRHEFVSSKHSVIAYSDAELELDDSRKIARPEMLATFLEAASITENDNVLEIGCGTGYCSAVVAKIAASVTGFDKSSKAIRKAEKICKKHNIQNVSFTSKMPSGDFSLILIQGAIFGENKLIDELRMKSNARIFCVRGTNQYSPMHIVRYTHDSKQVLNQVYFPEFY